MPDGPAAREWCGLWRTSLGHPWARVRGGPMPDSTPLHEATCYRLTTGLPPTYRWLTAGLLLADSGLTTGSLRADS